MGLTGAPTSPLDGDGTPQVGTYAGACRTTDLSSLNISRLRRATQEKGWQWFCAADEEFAVGGAIVDAGLANTAFVWVIDREDNRLVVDDSRILPPLSVTRADDPGSSPRVAASFVGVSLSMEQVDSDGTGGLAVSGRFGDLELDLTFESVGAGPVTAVCPVDGGDHPGVNVTQKETCLAANGTISFDGQTHTFADADGLLDFSHGVLARETTWRWAIGTGRTRDGTPIGFNVVDGFNEGRENAVWIGTERRQLESASFEFDRERPIDSWRVTAGRRLNVELTPEAVRSEHLNLGVVVSKYAQPFGIWRGTVAGRDVELVGVAETHQAKW